MQQSQLEPANECLDIDALIDKASEKLAESFSARFLRWFIRTAIGLIIFGVLWYFYEWAFWLFWGYFALVCLSFGANYYLHYKLATKISNIQEHNE